MFLENSKIKKILTIYQCEQNKPTFVPFLKLPPLFVESIICIEDRRFFQHRGIDLKGIARAFFTNLLNRKILEGASTITQQLVRQITLKKRKSYLRKFHEIYLSLLLEKSLSKQQILEFYLNTCYLGKFDLQNIHGISSAAKAIFQKAVNELNLSEISFLAALVGRPINSEGRPDQWMRCVCRQHLILQNLVTNKTIDSSTYTEALNQNIQLFTKTKKELPLETIEIYKRSYIRPSSGMKLFPQLLKLLTRQIFYDPLIHTVSTEHKIPFHFLKQVIKHESSYIDRATSRKGAKGLMQLLDATFVDVAARNKKNWTVQDIYNPKINVEAGALYLKQLRNYFQSKAKPEFLDHYTLAAYNFGPGNINKAIAELKEKQLEENWENLQNHLPKMTINYVNSILRRSLSSSIYQIFIKVLLPKKI